MEQKLKQPRKPGSLRAGAATSLRWLCPLCDENAYEHYPALPPPRRPGPQWHRFRPDPATWDAATSWDAAFPDLAYGTGQAPAPQEEHHAAC